MTNRNYVDVSELVKLNEVVKGTDKWTKYRFQYESKINNKFQFISYSPLNDYKDLFVKKIKDNTWLYTEKYEQFGNITQDRYLLDDEAIKILGL